MTIDHEKLTHPKGEYESLESGIKGNFCFIIRPKSKGGSGVEYWRYFCGVRCDNCRAGKFWECDYEDAGARNRKHDQFVSKQIAKVPQQQAFFVCEKKLLLV